MQSYDYAILIQSCSKLRAYSMNPVLELTLDRGSSIKDVRTEGMGVVSIRTGEGVIDDAHVRKKTLYRLVEKFVF